MKNEELIRDINEYIPETGKPAFWWFGQMGFALKMNEKVMYIDIFLPNGRFSMRPPCLTPEYITNADIIFGTHDHGDHIDRRNWPLYAKLSPNAKFVVPDILRASVSEGTGIPLERIIGVNDGETVDIDGIKVTGIASAHEFLDRDEATGKYPHMGYAVEANGSRIYHSGDTCRYDGLAAKIAACGRMDAMFIPINGRSGRKYRSNIIGNMTYQEAVDLAGELAPKIAVPGHYDAVAGNTEDPFLFADFIRAKYPEQKYWIGTPGERYVIE